MCKVHTVDFGSFRGYNYPMARERDYDVGSAQALRLMAGSGTVFYRDLACITTDSKFDTNLVAEVLHPTSSGIFFEIFRLDVRDSPKALNVDHYQIRIESSKAYIRNLGFEGTGHHCSDIPSSLACIPSML